MKKHLLILGVVSLSSYCYSDDSQTQETDLKAHRSNSDVYLSSPVHTFDAYFSALFLQPTSSNLHYAAEAVPLPAPSPDWKIFDIHTDYQFAFEVGIGGIIHNTNTNLNLNWEHFHSTDSSSKTVSSSNMIGPFFEIGPDASAYKKAHGHVVFHFDAANLDYGLFTNFGNRLHTNVFAGVGFSRIKQKLSSKYSNFEGTIVRTIKTPSTFVGAGPQVGLDFSYSIIKGLRFTGDALATLFVGNTKNHTQYTALAPELEGLGITPPNKQTTSVKKRTQVVPGFAGMLGFGYFAEFCKHYLIELEAGYRAQIYLNAIQSTDIGSEVVTPPVIPDTVGVFARTFQRSTSNFALAGPYVSLKIGF